MKRDQHTTKNASRVLITKRDKHVIKNHGGKRKGAGRPKDPGSIRSRYAEAVESDKTAKPYKHSYTLYEVRMHSFLSNHAHPLVLLLNMTPDKSTRARTTTCEHRPFLSLNAAVRIARLDEEKQIEVVKLSCQGLLRKFMEQYKDDPGFLGDKARMMFGGRTERGNQWRQ
jgi:hypothetical protein